MDDSIEPRDGVHERQWSRRGAVARAMSERSRLFTVHLDLDEDGEPAPTEDEHPPEVP